MKERKEWELHEDHDLEIRAVLREQGMMDGKGQIRGWGPKVIAVMNELGHTSVEFEICECKNRRE